MIELNTRVEPSTIRAVSEIDYHIKDNFLYLNGIKLGKLQVEAFPDNTIMLDNLNAAESGKGYGKKIVEFVIDTAKKHKQQIKLIAVPLRPIAGKKKMGREDLYKFYKSLGFKFTPDKFDNPIFIMDFRKKK